MRAPRRFDCPVGAFAYTWSPRAFLARVAFLRGVLGSSQVVPRGARSSDQVKCSER